MLRHPRVQGREQGCVHVACLHGLQFKVSSRRSTSLSTRSPCQIDQVISERGKKAVRYHFAPICVKFSSPYIGNCYFDETLPGGLHFRNSSRHVFSMYSKVTEAKDNEMVERWQKDAEGILIFVSPRARFRALILINGIAVGRFILCRRGSVTFSDGPGLEPESSASTPAPASGELGILSQEYLSGSLPTERLLSTSSLPYRSSPHVIFSDICHLGEFTMVFEPSDQSYLCNVGNIHTKMGMPIHRDHTVTTVQPTQASSASCLLLRRSRQVACFLGR